MAQPNQDLARRIFGKARRTYHKVRFDRLCARIRCTPALDMVDGGPLFVSMLRHSDVSAWLLAIKSVYRFIGAGRVLLIDDGTLRPADRRLILRHVPRAEFVPISAIDTGPCPRGGTWERLLKIVDLSATDYVIQIDADTLATAPLPEVVEAWRANRGFLLGTDVGRHLAPAAEVAKMVEGWGYGDSSVGCLAEAALGALPDADTALYVHASSGFAGFARGGQNRADVDAFSAAMQERLGAQWSRWGTEQVTSNWVIANSPRAIVLPFDRYACHEPGVDTTTRCFLHFIGSYRFDGGTYAARARQVIAACA